MQEIKKIKNKKKIKIKGSKNNAIDNNREDGDNRKEEKSSESNIIKEFDAILKNIKDNGRTTTSIGVKKRGNTINLHHLQNFELKIIL